MAILYTIDSMTVDKDKFKSIITEMGYFDLNPEDKTWTHVSTDHQITMIKQIVDKNGVSHTFCFSIDT